MKKAASIKKKINITPRVKKKTIYKANTVNIITNKIGSLSVVELTKDLIQSIDDNNVSMIRGQRFYSVVRLTKSAIRVKRKLLSKDSIDQFKNILKCLKGFKYVEFI